MGCSKSWRKLSAAHARSFRESKSNHDGVTLWEGGVDHDTDTENSDFLISEHSEDEDEDSVDGEGIQSGDDGGDVTRLVNSMQHEQWLLNREFGVMSEKQTKKDWEKAEKELKGRRKYTGSSQRTQQRKDKKEREKAAEDEIMRAT